MTPLGIQLVGVITQSEANARENRFTKAERAARQRKITALILRTHLIRGAIRRGDALTIIMTRVSRGLCDSDNLAGCFKHVRDGIADVLCVNDADHTSVAVTWRARQIKGPKAQTWVDIRRTSAERQEGILRAIEAAEGLLVSAGESVLREPRPR